jgi:hypothetical protein
MDEPLIALMNSDGIELYEDTAGFTTKCTKEKSAGTNAGVALHTS